jgi:hypothetical protein
MFFHTKFPTIKEKMKWMINDRKEAYQKVWLDMRNLKMSHHKKITLKREEPFKIDEVLGPVTY